MKIKILGTSNGLIPGGYARALKEIESVKVVDNLSVGSSHPCIVPLALKRDNLDVKSDIFIIDMCVNEQRAGSKGLYNNNLSRIFIDLFFQHCLSVSSIPLALLLPRVVNGCFEADSVLRWREICSKRNIPFLDVCELAQKYGNPSDLWRDSNHPSVDFSKVIAKEIVKISQSCVFDFDQFDSTPENEDIVIFRCPIGSKIVRTTSLLSRDFYRAIEGDYFEVRLDSGLDFEILGASLNMAQTHAAVKYQGSNCAIQRYDNDYYDPKKPLWYVAWGLVQPVLSIQGSVFVSIEKPMENNLQYKNDHITKRINSDDKMDVAIELEALVLRTFKNKLNINGMSDQ